VRNRRPGEDRRWPNGKGNPRLSGAAQRRLDNGLNQEQNIPNPDFVIPLPTGDVPMSLECFNLWQTAIVASEILAGKVRDPFIGKGLTTSFHHGTSTTPLEPFFGNLGSANNFFGIPYDRMRIKVRLGRSYTQSNNPRDAGVPRPGGAGGRSQ